jgi:eukaryotic-like serine/threonine-protein kinase
VYVRGEAYLAAGQGSAAVEFQKILDHGGIVWIAGREQWLIWEWLAPMPCSRRSCRERVPTLPVSPRSRDKDFLTLWKDADSDIPILKEAKTEYAKLQ